MELVTCFCLVEYDSDEIVTSVLHYIVWDCVLD